MSDYNSENTKILAKHKLPGGITMMLLLHETGCVQQPYQYVVGSDFKETRYNGVLGYERWDYSWDWAHYFVDIISAADYWKREVLPNYDEHTCPHCGQEGELELESSEDYDDDKIYWYRCGNCKRLSKQSFGLFENIPVAG